MPLYPWMLALGGLLVLLPILIHLFNKTRYRVEPWGAMMFLQKAMQVRSQRIKIEQLILLFLRCLFLIALAFAFARPFSQWGEGDGKEATTYCLIIDDSYSMQQGEGTDSAFAKARKSALEIVDSMRNRDNMLIVRAGNTPREAFNRPSFDQNFLRSHIEDMQPGTDQTMDLPRALDRAGYLLTRSGLPRHRLVVLTDGQRQGWRADDELRWQKVGESRESLKIKPSVYVLAQAPEETVVNVAVRSLRPRSPVVDIFRSTTFLVELHNTSDRPRPLTLTFEVDGTTQGDRAMDVPPGVHTYEFQHRFTVPKGADVAHPESSHFVVARIDDDDLPLDNEMSLALQVSHTLPVLVIDGGPTEDVWESDGGMLSLALDSAAEFGRRGLFTVEHRGLTELDDLNSMELGHFHAVVLANVPSLSRNLQFALEQFVQRGGGLFIALGDQTKPLVYHKLMDEEGGGILPAKMVEIVNLEQGKPPFQPRFDAGSAAGILDVFDTTRTRVLRDVRVRSYWRCEPAENTMVLGQFDDDPFLMVRAYGLGKVVLWTTSLNADWTTMPLTPDFLPLAQNLLLYIAAQSAAPVNLAQSETLVFSRCHDGSAVAGQGGDNQTNSWESCTVVTPGGEEIEVEGQFVGGEWVAEYQNTATAGVYTVRMPGRDPKHYAVALQPGESDLEPLESDARERFSDEGLVTKYVDSQQELSQAIAKETGEREWWRWFVFFALAILCLELFLGWRFSGA